MQKVVIFSDGGSRGNPGSGAGAAIIFDDGKKSLHSVANFFGHCTNNQAEYRALLDGLKYIVQTELFEDLIEIELQIFLDSELMVKQLNGEYKVKNEGLKEFYDEIQQLLSQFGQVSVTHVTRGNNVLSDSLVNAVLDRWEA